MVVTLSIGPRVRESKVIFARHIKTILKCDLISSFYFDLDYGSIYNRVSSHRDINDLPLSLVYFKDRHHALFKQFDLHKIFVTWLLMFVMTNVMVVPVGTP